MGLLLLTGSLFGASINSVTTYEEAILKAKTEHKKVMLFLHTQYCGWCTKMKKTTLADPLVIDFINKKYIFVSLDRDIDSYPAQFAPRFVPTTYTIDPKSQKEIDSVLGYKKRDDFIYGLSEE